MVFNLAVFLGYRINSTEKTNSDKSSFDSGFTRKSVSNAGTFLMSIHLEKAVAFYGRNHFEQPGKDELQ